MKLNHPTAANSISDFLGPEWLAQRKLDGVRLAVVWGTDGRASYGLTKGGKQTPPPGGLPSMPAGTVVDGEIVGSSWEDALAALAAEEISQWVAFDLAAYPEPVGGLLERLEILREHGLDPVPAGPVLQAWERVLYDGGEGVVIRNATATYGAPAFKIKPERLLNAIAHRGYLMVLDGGKPRTIGRCSSESRGRVVVICEGATVHNKVRAPRIIGPAAPGAFVGVEQLERLVIR